MKRYTKEEHSLRLSTLSLATIMFDEIKVHAENILRAAQSGNLEGFDTASINCANNRGKTALMLAADSGSLLALKRLLNAGADPNLYLPRNTNSYISGGTRRNISHDISLDINGDTSRVTALTIAMKIREPKCVEELIRAGCFFNCERGLDALKMAKYRGFMAAVAQGEKVMKTNLKQELDQRRTAFYVALINERVDLLTALMDAGLFFNLKSLSCKNVTEKERLLKLLPISALTNLSEALRHLEKLLTQAVQLNEISIVTILIEKYGYLDIVNFSKNKALQVACDGGQVELVNAMLAGAKLEVVSSSYIEVVESLVNSGADVSCVDEDGSTLLMKAVRSKQIDIVKFLIAKKLYIDQKDHSQSTALYYACKSTNQRTLDMCVGASMTSITEIIKLLINAGSDINGIDSYHRTPFIKSISEANLDTTQFLLENGADISKVDIDGLTPLMWAAKTENAKVLDLLLDLKPEVNCVDRNRMTALGHAVISSNVQIVAKLIKAGADVNLASNYQLSCNVTSNQTFEFLIKMQHIVEQISCSKNTPLHLAGTLRCNSIEIVNLLLKSGAKVEAVDEHDKTPLHIAAIVGNLEITHSLCQFGAKINAVDLHGNSPLFISILLQHKDISTYLLECGADVNLMSDSLCSPLFVAVLYNDTELVHLLIQHGALVDRNKESELIIALEHRNVEVVIALLENGANANIRDTKNTPVLTIAIKLARHFDGYVFARTPFNTIKDSGTICSMYFFSQMLGQSVGLISTNEVKSLTKLFLTKGANVSATDYEGNTGLHAAIEFCSADVLELFVAHEADVNVQNVEGETPLMMACRRGNVEAVRYLLSVGADVMFVDANKNTALHHSAIKQDEFWPDGHMISEWLACTITLLIENNANIHARDEQGNTALHLAVKFDLDQCVGVLIKLGANVNDQNNEGNTSLFLMTNHKLIHYFMDARTDINLQNKLGETALHHAFNDDVGRELLAMGAEKEIHTHEGRTALMCATAWGNFSLAQCLVEHGANVNVKDNEGRNALMLAIEYIANMSKYDRICSPDILKILLNNGADVDASDATGQTACMMAFNKARSDYCLEVLPKLVEFGVDLNKQDNKNRSVLVHILLDCKNNKLDCILEILRRGAEMVIDIEFQYLVKEMKQEMETEYAYGRTTSYWTPQMVQFALVNGCILIQGCNLWGTDQTLKIPHFLSCEYLIFIKYLFATGMIFKSDLQSWRKFEENNSLHATTIHIPPELQAAIHEPWPLVKLAFIEVSTLLGTGPTREEKLKQTKLPPRLQRMLMFQEPISRLPIEDWSKIPLCFDPVQYETLPCPRPLLYYWPVGHMLIN